MSQTLPSEPVPSVPVLVAPSATSIVPRREQSLAVTNALGAYLIWGVVGWYFQFVTAVLAPTVASALVTFLAHRAVWSLAFTGAVLGIRGELRLLLAAFRIRRVMLGLFATSLLIAVNWLTFVYAAHAHRLVEASVGYFLSPLMSVLLGVVLLGERLRRGQLIAVLIAAAGVSVLVATKSGQIWISIVLMASWSFYVLLRKRIPVGPLVGFCLETAILTPLAAGYIAYDFAALHASLSPQALALLAAGGIITATPLIMFAYAARRLTMATLGLTQYIGPTVQFIVAAVVLREGVTRPTLAGFALIWTGLIVFSIDGYRTFRRSMRSAD